MTPRPTDPLRKRIKAASVHCRPRDGKGNDRFRMRLAGSRPSRMDCEKGQLMAASIFA